MGSGATRPVDENASNEEKSDQALLENRRHIGVECNECGQEIVGTDWKALGEDFDFCNLCYETTIHDKTSVIYLPILLPYEYITHSADIASHKITDVVKAKYQLTEIIFKQKVVSMGYRTNLKANFKNHPLVRDVVKLTNNFKWKAAGPAQDTFFIDCGRDVIGVMDYLLSNKTEENLYKLRLILSMTSYRGVYPPWVVTLSRLWETHLLRELDGTPPEIDSQTPSQIPSPVKDILSSEVALSSLPLPLSPSLIPGGQGVRHYVLPGLMKFKLNLNYCVDQRERITSDEVGFVESETYFSHQLTNHAQVIDLFEPGHIIATGFPLATSMNPAYPLCDTSVSLTNKLNSNQMVGQDLLSTARIIQQYTDNILQNAITNELEEYISFPSLSSTPLSSLSSYPLLSFDLLTSYSNEYKHESFKNKERERDSGIIDVKEIIRYHITLKNMSEATLVMTILSNQIFHQHLLLSVRPVCNTMFHSVTAVFGIRFADIVANESFFDSNDFQVYPEQFFCISLSLSCHRRNLTNDYAHILGEVQQIERERVKEREEEREKEKEEEEVIITERMHSFFSLSLSIDQILFDYDRAHGLPEAVYGEK